MKKSKKFHFCIPPEECGKKENFMSDNFSAKEIVICLPTYNESENLRQTAAAILTAVPRVSILIIDDNSPDGTGCIADQMACEDPRISVLHRARKQGLGRAYLDGFRTVLKQPHVRLIGQMDADLSHPPDRLPAMIHAAEFSDLVIGSRYVPGGGTRNWNFYRKFISRFGSLYARAWLGMPVRDLTGGFKIWRRSLLETVLEHPVNAGGYVFQVETSFLAFRLGARITELPILFTDRNVGKSKMTADIALEAFWRLPAMRVRKVRKVRSEK